MARTTVRTENADRDTCAEIEALCREIGISKAEYYERSGLNKELSLPMFYAALRDDAVTAGTERAVDLSLLVFKDWLDSARGRKAVRENPGQLLKLARRQALEMAETLKRLSVLMGD